MTLHQRSHRQRFHREDLYIGISTCLVIGYSLVGLVLLYGTLK